MYVIVLSPCFIVAYNSQDTTCILLPPRRSVIPTPGVLNQIIAALATRYSTTVTVIRKHLIVDQIEEWGKVRRTDGGDTMNTSSMATSAEDRRDATFVRVSPLQSCAMVY
jgi:hypothetical protein